MNVAFDVDGTIDSFVRPMQSTMSAYTAAGHRVYVITGIEAEAVLPSDVAAKQQYLSAMGIGTDCYFQLIVCPKPHPDNKAKAIQDNDIEMLFDNDKKNVKAAAPYCAALLLWNSK